MRVTARIRDRRPEEVCTGCPVLLFAKSGNPTQGNPKATMSLAPGGHWMQPPSTRASREAPGLAFTEGDGIPLPPKLPAGHSPSAASLKACLSQIRGSS